MNLGDINGTLYTRDYNIPYVANIHQTSRYGNYTEPYLTTTEWAKTIGLGSFFGSVIARPLHHLERFFFLTFAPADMPVSDKRPMLFETMASTKWLKSFDGRTIPFLTFSNFGYLSAYQAAFYGMGESVHWVSAGLIAGAFGGLVHSLIVYPHDVLVATAKASLGTPQEMKSPWDVLRVAIRHKPEVLRGLYKGYGPVLGGHMAQGAVALGGYNALKYEALQRGPMYLFAAIWFTCYCGYFCLYPFQQAKTMLRQTNAGLRHSRVGYAEMIQEINKRYGITYLYKGAFSGAPSLAVLPTAISLYIMDAVARGSTEYMHPERKRNDRIGAYYFKLAEQRYEKSRSAVEKLIAQSKSLSSPAAVEVQKETQRIQEERVARSSGSSGASGASGSA